MIDKRNCSIGTPHVSEGWCVYRCLICHRTLPCKDVRFYSRSHQSPILLHRTVLTWVFFGLCLSTALVIRSSFLTLWTNCASSSPSIGTTPVTLIRCHIFFVWRSLTIWLSSLLLKICSPCLFLPGLLVCWKIKNDWEHKSFVSKRNTELIHLPVLGYNRENRHKKTSHCDTAFSILCLYSVPTSIDLESSRNTSKIILLRKGRPTMLDEPKDTRSSHAV